MRVISDLLDHWAEWAVMLALVAVHLLLTLLLPIDDVVGNCPKYLL
jgi:hypothetical protein